MRREDARRTLHRALRRHCRRAALPPRAAVRRSEPHRRHRLVERRRVLDRRCERPEPRARAETGRHAGAAGFAAAIAVYPGGCYSLVNELVTRPLLVLMGEADDWTLPGPCVEMVANMRRRGADATIVLYPGAVHYFDVVGQRRTCLADVGTRT